MTKSFCSNRHILAQELSEWTTRPLRTYACYVIEKLQLTDARIHFQAVRRAIAYIIGSLHGARVSTGKIGLGS